MRISTTSWKVFKISNILVKITKAMISGVWSWSELPFGVRMSSPLGLAFFRFFIEQLELLLKVVPCCACRVVDSRVSCVGLAFGNHAVIMVVNADWAGVTVTGARQGVLGRPYIGHGRTG